MRSPQTPLVTVLMPVYNAQSYLKEAIDSILNQSHTDFEFLIVDDGSTDESVNISNSYSDSRIRLIQQSNAGKIKSEKAQVLSTIKEILQ